MIKKSILFITLLFSVIFVNAQELPEQWKHFTW